MNTTCRHCPHCGKCYASYRDYIEHFRIGGRLMFSRCTGA
jgi:uncharacterized C2H2 Zn-finger protein